MFTSSKVKNDSKRDGAKKRSLLGSVRFYTRSAQHTGMTVGLQALGLKTDMDANHEARERLFTKARSCREKATNYNGPHDIQLLKNLNEVLDLISSFEMELAKRSLAALNAALDGQKVDSYEQRLNDTWSLFHADITFRQKPQSNDFSAPYHIDQILPLLPKHVSNYVGHEEELQRLVVLLRMNSSAHAIILGTGGIGKTAMVTKALYDEKVEFEFKNRRFFIDCDGIITAEGIAAALASVFNVTESPGSALQQAILNHLRSLHSRIVIVLDNLESAWLTDEQNHVETFLSHLGCIDLLAIVVTMRGTSPPDGPIWHEIINLKPLEKHDAHILFTALRHHSTVPDDHDLRELLGLLDGLPLAITLIASVGLAAGYTPSKLLAAYRSERTSMATRGRGKDRLTSLDISISLSINCQTMTDHPEALKLLGLLSLLPDGLQEKEHTLVFPTMTKYRPTARVLVQVALCTLNDETYRVLAPIREYIQANHPLNEHALHLQELRQYYFRLALRGRDWEQEPSAVLTEVGPNVNNIQAVLGHGMTTASTADGMDVLQALDGLSELSHNASVGDCKPYLQAALSVYQKMCDSQDSMKRLLAACRLRLADIIYRQCDYDGATSYLMEARQTFQDIGDRLGVAQCMRRLGEIKYIRSDYNGAITALNDAKAEFQSIENHLGAAQCTRRIGNILYMRSRYDDATAALQEAKAVFEDIGNHLGAAQCMQNLGDVLQMRGSYDDAIAILQDAKMAFEDIGNRLGAARCMQSLGEVMSALGNYEGSTAALQEAKTVFSNIGNRLGAAQCMRSLGDVMSMLGNYEDAIATLEEAKAAFKDIGNRRGVARCMRSLGEFMYVLGNYEDGTAALQEAKAAFEEIGNRSGMAQCLRSLGDIMSMQGNYEEATSALQKAKAIFTDVGNRRGTAQCLRSLGDILSVLGTYEDATAALQEAKLAFEDIGNRLGSAQCLRGLGDIMSMTGNYEDATAALQEAKAAFEDIGNRLGSAQCMRSIGDVLYRQGRYEHATTTLEAAKAAFEDIGDRRGAAQCTQSLADVTYRMGNYGDAKVTVEEVKEAFRAIGYDPGVTRCTKSMVDILAQESKTSNGVDLSSSEISV